MDAEGIPDGPKRRPGGLFGAGADRQPALVAMRWADFLALVGVEDDNLT